MSASNPSVENLAEAPRSTKIWAVFRVASGNFLEMYDFMVFGYYASAIGRAFFPSKDPFASLMLSLMDLWGRVLNAADRRRPCWAPTLTGWVGARASS